MPNELSFGMIESAWETKLAYSARPVFDLLSHRLTGKIDSYNYEKVGGPDAFKEVMAQLLSSKLKFILISCHGDGGKLCLLPSKKFVAASTIQKLLQQASFAPVGLFVDACKFGTPSNAKTILSTGIEWFASYRKDAGWVESLSFVLLFWSILRDQDGGERERVNKTMDFFKKDCSGLLSRLGFHLWIKERSSERLIDLASGD